MHTKGDFPEGGSVKGGRMKNIDIRIAVSDAGLKYQDIAAQMGISKFWLSKMMRNEMSKKNRERVLRAINELITDGAE